MKDRAAGESRVLTRRELLAFGGSVAAVAALGACTPVTSSPVSTATSSASISPKRGGTVTWAQVLDNSLIDLPAIASASAMEIGGNLSDSLVSIDKDLNLHPWLATKWSLEDGGKRYTFTLRDDVKFHDGTPLDSTAVKRTFDRLADPQTKAAQAAGLLGPLDHIETPDARTVVLLYKSPHPLLLLSLWRCWFGILSPKQLDSVKPGEIITAPVGTGPFKFAGRSADGVVTLERNPDYKWGPEFMRNREAPYLDAVKFRRVNEASTRTATLESGESLLVDDLPEGDYTRLKADARFAFFQVNRRGPAFGFQFNFRKPSSPVSDLGVRQAMNWAIDRQAIVDKLFFGVHHPLVGPLSEGVWGRLDELEKTYPYSGDKKKAAEILDAAGWKVGAGGIREKGTQKLSLVLASVAGDLKNDLADAVQLQVREIGIDLQVQKMPQNNWLEFTRSYKHDLCDAPGANFDPDELRNRFHSAAIGGVNYAGLSDPTLDDLLVKGQLAPLGSDVRRQIYADVQRRMMALQVNLSMISVIRTYAMPTRVKGGVVGHPTGVNLYPLTDIWLDS